MVEKHGEEQEKTTLEFRERGNPGDGLRVHGMQGEPESGPKSERWSCEGCDEQIGEAYHRGVEENIEEMPGGGMLAKRSIFGGVDEELQGAVVVGAGAAFFGG